MAIGYTSNGVNQFESPCAEQRNREIEGKIFFRNEKHMSLEYEFRPLSDSFGIY